MKTVVSFLVCLLILVSSCETIIKLDFPEHSSKLVINGLLTPDSLVRVAVYKSLPVFDNQSVSYVSDATVVLFEDERLIDTLRFNQAFRQYMAGSFKPGIGKEYRLEVSAPGYDPVKASCSIADEVKIIQTQLKDSAGIDEYGAYYSQLSLTFNDPPGVKNYYNLFGLVPAVLIPWIPSNSGADRDTVYFYNPQYFFSNLPLVEYTYGNGIVLNDELFDGNTYTLSVNFYPQYNYRSNIPDARKERMKLIFKNTDFIYYNYNRKLQPHIGNQNGGIFSGEPVIMPTNIENGYGIFSGYSADTLTLY
ncbi:DUF4249 domain-containing protein [Rhodocytophaga rosea]|uniref:DUF4249 domain-containing protein n=1 Tax=Rhodocytophaga rosea TaxID=2704465 RepID=A0A6C0GG67_9BACT|nr:DUF4249 domain-containing protein [Rhodocytophaga rosea]QHT66988.1 DUF4249 domain-containing protein [Rhodocytophaga rosea]